MLVDPAERLEELNRIQSILLNSLRASALFSDRQIRILRALITMESERILRKEAPLNSTLAPGIPSNVHYAIGEVQLPLRGPDYIREGDKE